MRLMVKPGITGLAQVENGYTKTIGEMKGKLFYDLKYIANLSLAQEITHPLQDGLRRRHGQGRLLTAHPESLAESPPPRRIDPGRIS